MRCPTCGSGVTVLGDPEGTCSYEPAEATILRNALRTITTAASHQPDDPGFGGAYARAGGGYEGLQAVAGLGLRLADEARA